VSGAQWATSTIGRAGKSRKPKRRFRIGWQTPARPWFC
jgi:hypothetical protein